MQFAGPNHQRDGVLSTDLYRKETDKPTALLPSSAHPGNITGNIVYSMGFRLLRICNEEDIFEKKVKGTKNKFSDAKKF